MGDIYVPDSRGAGGGMTGFSDMVDERLLRERIIWLEGEVRDENSNSIAKQLQVLAADDPEQDITLYINSPGGSITAGMVIYDAMELIPNDVATVAMGMAATMGSSCCAPALRASDRHPEHAHHDAPALRRAGRHGVGHQDPGRADAVHQEAHGRAHRRAHRPDARADREGLRPHRWFDAEAAREYGIIDHVYSTAADSPEAKATKGKGDSK